MPEIVLNPAHKKILLLFRSVDDSITSSQVQSKLKVGRPTAFFHLEEGKNSLSLVNQGLIEPIGQRPKIYVLTEKGKSVCQSILGGYVKIEHSSRQSLNAKRNFSRVRSHNIMLKLNIIRRPRKDFVLNHFEEVNRNYVMNNWKGVSGRYDGDFFLITNKSLVFQPEEIYARPFVALSRVYSVVKSLVKLLEKDNPGLKFESDYVVIVKQEYAYEGDAFAVAVKKLNIIVRTDRFHVDLSKGPEIEFPNPRSAPEDAEVWRNKVEEMIRLTIDDELDFEKLKKSRQDKIDFVLDKLVDAVTRQVDFERESRERMDLFGLQLHGLESVKLPKAHKWRES